MSKQITLTQRHEIAKQLDLNEPFLYQCLTGRRNMNPADAVRVEQGSKGLISRFDLCQTTAYQIWPELAKKRKPALEKAQGVV